MNKLKIFYVIVLLVVGVSLLTGYSKSGEIPMMGDTVYDPPVSYTANYALRLWSEGDRPGADSVNQNLIDIDAYIYNVDTMVTYVSGVLTAAVVAERNARNDSLTRHRDTLVAHKIFIHALRGEFLNVANIVSVLEDSSSAHTTALARLRDTLNNVPRLNGLNTFTGQNITSSDWTFNDTVDFNSAMKENHITGHLVSEFGANQEVAIWVSATENGQATVHLRVVPITINGTTYYLLYYNP